MTERALVATRKGLFTVARGAGGWAVTAVAFPGDNVPIMVTGEIVSISLLSNFVSAS